jgi:hypothetical protein
MKKTVDFLSKENPNFGNKNQVILEFILKVSRLGGGREREREWPVSAY